MSSTDVNKSGGKSARRAGKGKQRSKKPDPVESPTPVENRAPIQMQSPEPDQQLHAETHQAQSPTADLEPAVNEPIEAAVTAPDVLPVVPPTAAPSPAEPAPAEPAPVSLQTIANAYRDYTRKSFEEIGCYFEQLTSARSLDKAMKVQADFMKRAYETSVSESRRIYELHNRLAKQTFQPFQSLVGKRPETHGKS
jgi:Phasin protein